MREGGIFGLLHWIEWALHLFLLLWSRAVIPGVKGSLCGHHHRGLLLIFGIWFVLEPGYYEDGAFGIRIENVVLVVPVKTKVSIY